MISAAVFCVTAAVAAAATGAAAAALGERKREKSPFQKCPKMPTWIFSKYVPEEPEESFSSDPNPWRFGHT